MAGLLAPLVLAAALSATPSTGVAIRRPAAGFAEGVSALARSDRFTDPGALTAWLGVTLRNPQKWTHQPEGSYRTAGWLRPPSRWGIATLHLMDVWSEPAPDYEASLTIELSGRPCLSIRAIERATGTRATFGGIVVPLVMDGPSPGPRRLGNDHATLVLRNLHGRETAIAMVSTRPDRAGCLRSLTISSTRPRR